MTETAAPLLATCRRVVKVFVIVLASVALMPLQWLVLRFSRGPLAFVLPRLWFTCLKWALGIRAEVIGTPRREGGTVYVGNHVSHFDIVLLGSLLGARFIAKDDMEGWPGMNFVGALGQTIFISRRNRDAASVVTALNANVRPGDNLVLFPEGTTSSGENVAPFKSSVFAMLLGRADARYPWTVQPFTLDIRSVDGRLLAAGGCRDDYAFHGAMDAGRHVKRFMGLSGAVVRVVFHPPISIRAHVDRKTLATNLHGIVASGLPSAVAAVS